MKFGGHSWFMIYTTIIFDDIVYENVYKILVLTLVHTFITTAKSLYQSTSEPSAKVINLHFRVYIQFKMFEVSGWRLDGKIL